MYCRNCGNQISEGANFCLKCGSPVGTAAVQVPVTKVDPESTLREAEKAKLHKGIVTRFICLLLVAVIGLPLPFLKLYSIKGQRDADKKYSFIDMFEDRSDISRSEKLEKLEKAITDDNTLEKINFYEKAAIVCYIIALFALLMMILKLRKGDYVYEKKRHGYFWLWTAFASAMFMASLIFTLAYADCLNYSNNENGWYIKALPVCVFMIIFAAVRCVMVLNKMSRKITFRKKSNSQR